jgi:hypothetical protein
VDCPQVIITTVSFFFCFCNFCSDLDANPHFSSISLFFRISTPLDLFQSHHETISGGADVSLAFVGLHSALSLFNSSAFLLLLPGWPALDLGGDAIGQCFFELMIPLLDMHSHTHQENWLHFACSWFTGTLLLSQPALASRVKLTLMGPHQVTAVPFCLELVLCFVCTQPPSLLYFHFQFLSDASDTSLQLCRHSPFRICWEKFPTACE